MSEAALQRRIVSVLREGGWYCWKQESSGLAGLPDLAAVKDGQVVFLEVKQPGGAISPSQKIAIDNLRSHGAVVGVVRSLDEAMSVIEGRHD